MTPPTSMMILSKSAARLTNFQPAALRLAHRHPLRHHRPYLPHHCRLFLHRFPTPLHMKFAIRAPTDNTPQLKSRHSSSDVGVAPYSPTCASPSRTAWCPEPSGSPLPLHQPQMKPGSSPTPPRSPPIRSQPTGWSTSSA